MSDKPNKQQPTTETFSDVIKEINELKDAFTRLSANIPTLIQEALQQHDLKSEDDIKMLIANQLDNYTTKSEVDKLIGDATASVNSGVKRIRINFDEFTKSIHKAIDENTNRINEYEKQIDKHRDRDIDHDARITILENEFTVARDDRRRLREDLMGDGKDQRGLVGRIDGIESSITLMERSLAGIVELQQKADQREQQREQQQWLQIEIEAYKEDERRMKRKRYKSLAKVAGKMIGVALGGTAGTIGTAFLAWLAQTGA